MLILQLLQHSSIAHFHCCHHCCLQPHLLLIVYHQKELLCRLCLRIPIRTTRFTYVYWTVHYCDSTARLAVFERKILRSIYGPVKVKELWRIQQNDELEAIIKGENIVRFIKGQRIRWLGHIEIMQDTTIPKKMYGKLYATRRRVRPKMRWLGDVSTDLRKMGINEWRDRARDREAWRRIVKWPRPTPGCSTTEEELLS